MNKPDKNPHQVRPSVEEQTKAIKLLLVASNTGYNDPKGCLKMLDDFDAMIDRGELLQSEVAMQCHRAYKIYLEGAVRARLDSNFNPTQVFRKAGQMLASCPDRLVAVNTMLLIAEMLERNMQFEEMMWMLLKCMEYFDSPDVGVPESSEMFDYYSREQAHSDRDFVTFLRAFTMLRLARAYRLRSQYDLTFRYYYRSLQCFKLLETVDSRNWSIMLKVDASNPCHYLGLEFRAHELLVEARTSARETHNKDIHALLATHELKLTSSKMDPDSFNKRFDALLEESSKLKFVSQMNALHKTRAIHLVALERWEEAHQTVEKALESCTLPRHAVPLVHWLIFAAKVRLGMKDGKGAISYAEQAIQLAHKMKDRYVEMQANVILSRANMQQHKLQAAYEALSRHLDLKEQTVGSHIIHRIAEAENEYKNGGLREELRRVKYQNDLLHAELQRKKTSVADLNAAAGQAEDVQSNGHSSQKNITKTSTEHKFAEDSWKQFADEFNIKYPGFNGRIYDICPELTETELKVCALCRAGLSVKQSADILILAENSVLKNRWRIRKKLKLQRSVKLAIYLRSI